MPRAGVSAAFTELDLRAGTRALARLREGALAPADIVAIPAAAGGPKGLALIPLDRLLAHWLAGVARLELVGASIGAWRMAALAQAEPLAALDRLAHAYVHEQNYRAKPAPAEVAATIRRVAASVLAGGRIDVRPGIALDVLTARARGRFAGREDRSAFARVAAANALGRRRLASHFERVVFHAGARSRLGEPFDAFGVRSVPLDAANTLDALTASGSIPLVCSPVTSIAGAPPGAYWDGGMIDYHLLLPHGRGEGIVLFPHFAPYVTPGWLDKFLPWRRRPRAHPWLANMLLVAPSPAFLARLPDRKLPDRNDFYRYGTDHAARIGAWTRALAECERFADAALRWLERPALECVRRL